MRKLDKFNKNLNKNSAEKLISKYKLQDVHIEKLKKVQNKIR